MDKIYTYHLGSDVDGVCIIEARNKAGTIIKFLKIASDIWHSGQVLNIEDYMEVIDDNDK